MSCPVFWYDGTSISFYIAFPKHRRYKYQDNSKQYCSNQHRAGGAIEASQPFGDRAAAQGAKRGQANQRYGVITHHAAAHFVGDHDLNEGCNDGGKERGSDSDNEQQQYTQPKRGTQGKTDQGKTK